MTDANPALGRGIAQRPGPSSGRPRATAALGWLAGGAWALAPLATLAILNGLAARLDGPPLSSWSGLRVWLSTTEPVTAALAVLRLLAVGLAWYLIALTALTWLARVTRWEGLGRAVQAVTVPAARSFVTRASGVSLAVATVAFSAAGCGPSGPSNVREVRVTTERSRPAGTPGSTPLSPVPGRVPSAPLSSVPGPIPAASLSPVVDPIPAASLTTVVDPIPAASLSEVAGPIPAASLTDEPQPTADLVADLSPPAAVQPNARFWVVEPGDHLWTIARRTLAQGRAQSPSEAAVADYWRRVVEANRAGLVNPDDPDLIFAGQQILLPPLPVPVPGT